MPGYVIDIIFPGIFPDYPGKPGKSWKRRFLKASTFRPLIFRRFRALGVHYSTFQTTCQINYKTLRMNSLIFEQPCFFSPWKTKITYLFWVEEAEKVQPLEKALFLFPSLDKVRVFEEAGDEAPDEVPWPPLPGTAKEHRKLVEFVHASLIWRLRRGCCGGVVEGLRLILPHVTWSLFNWPRDLQISS